MFSHIRSVFRCFFASVSYVCFECFNYFILMLLVFHLDVSKIDLMLQLVFQIHVSCVSFDFRHMLQVLHPDILKVDRVFHICLHVFAASLSP
jgi:hypothetical protein